MPGATQNYISPVLTGAAVKFIPPGLSWDKAMPVKSVVKESGIWYKWDKSEFDAPPTNRANGTPANITGAGFTQDNYFCQEEALKILVTDRDKDNADDPVELEMRSSQLVKQQVQNGLELRVFGAGGYVRTNANLAVAPGTLDLTNLATASPRAAFDLAKDRIFEACGQDPNTCFAGADVVRNVMRTAEYRDEFKYVTDIRNADLPGELYGLNLHTVGGLSTGGSFVRGKAKTISRILGNFIFIAYIDNSEAERVLTWGRSFVQKELVSSWYDPNVQGTWLEYSIIIDHKVVAKECGYRIDVTR